MNGSMFDSIWSLPTMENCSNTPTPSRERFVGPATASSQSPLPCDAMNLDEMSIPNRPSYPQLHLERLLLLDKLDVMQKQVESRDEALAEARCNAEIQANIQADQINTLEALNNNLNAMLETAEVEMDDRNTSVMRAKSEARKHREKTEELQAKLTDSEMRRHFLRGRLIQSEKEVKARDARAEELVNMNREMTLDMEKKQQDWEILESSLRKQLEDVSKATLVEHQKLVQDAEKKFQASQEAQASFAEALFLARAEIDKLRMDLSTAREEARNELKAAEEDIESVTTQLLTCQDELKKVKSEIESVMQTDSAHDPETMQCWEEIINPAKPGEFWFPKI
ncbi:hypothetical protein HYE67_007679 [Fusarium culmorum]|uniref:Uncharacterized protein n=1 Tax=Fusarium culmorum TaxID=5516 RepID=A0A2T4H2U0_FUSCU|nr:hypothetical protein FCULG_00008780 [Fusarium culmorum]QPC65448.1 hypothetical protein HYE67_007679 [Fusarium culmorum]